MRKLLIIVLLMFVIVLAGCSDKKEDEEITLQLIEGIDTIELDETWVDKGVLYTTGTTTVTIYSSDTIDNSELGTQEITYRVTSEGTEYVITRYVSVLDQTDPVLTILEGVDTILLNGTWTDSGCDVIDNSGETLTCTKIGTVDITSVGVYEVTYIATDSSGNEGAIIRYVNVIE